MRKEFKFVKGLYTDKKLFDDDIIKDSFVILDNNKEGCKEVSFDAEDNSETQSQLIKASEDRVCKLYTITPDKITMEGNLEKGTEGSFYKFTPTVKTNAVDDGEPIPPNVQTKAKEILEERLTADYSALKTENIGIGENTSPETVKVTFTDESKKSFTRDMVFRVEGKVYKKLFEDIPNGTVDLTNNTVYVSRSDNNGYDIANVKATDVFIDGRKQKKVDGTLIRFPVKQTTLEIYNTVYVRASEVAHKYIAPTGYEFDIISESDKSVLTADYIGEHSDVEYRLTKKKDADVNQEHLTFYLPDDYSSSAYDSLVDNGTYTYYFITDSGNLGKMTKNNYPYGQSILTYDKEDYNVYGGQAYINEDNKTYKVLGNAEEEDVSGDFVSVLGITTISPKSSKNYIVELGTSSIKARESQSY